MLAQSAPDACVWFPSPPPHRSSGHWDRQGTRSLRGMGTCAGQIYGMQWILLLGRLNNLMKCSDNFILARPTFHALQNNTVV